MDHAQVRRQILQRVLHDAGQHHGSQVPGIVGRVIQWKTVGGKETDIKRYVVADDGMGPDEVPQLVGHRWKGRRALDMLGRDARQALDEFGNRTARVDEGPEYVDLVVALEFDRADLDYSVSIGVEARRLQIKGHVFLVKRSASHQFLTLTQLGHRLGTAGAAYNRPSCSRRPRVLRLFQCNRSRPAFTGL